MGSESDGEQAAYCGEWMGRLRVVRILHLGRIRCVTQTTSTIRAYVELQARHAKCAFAGSSATISMGAGPAAGVCHRLAIRSK